MSEDKESTAAALRESMRRVRGRFDAEREAIRSEHGIGKEVWPMYGGLAEDYDGAFLDLKARLGIPPFRDFLLERKKGGYSTNVLDLMGGDASFLRDLRYPEKRDNPPSPLDAGLCVTLVDGRSRYFRQIDEKLGIAVLCGDLTSNGTWRRIDEWQRNRGVEAFDLIICRGGKGLDTISGILYPYLFNKVWQRLSRNNGVFLTQLHPDEERRMRRLAKTLKSVPGVKFSIRRHNEVDLRQFFPSIGVIKTINAPENLA